MKSKRFLVVMLFALEECSCGCEGGVMGGQVIWK